MAPLLITTEIAKPDGTTRTRVGLSPWAIVAAAIAGGLLALGGIAFDAIDVYFAILAKQPPHTTHLVIGLGVFVLGLVVAFGHYVLNPLSQLVVIVGNSSLPVIGGRRAGDPQLPSASSNQPPSVPFPPSDAQNQTGER